jgi:hypothetical protein
VVLYQLSYDPNRAAKLRRCVVFVKRFYRAFGNNFSTFSHLRNVPSADKTGFCHAVSVGGNLVAAGNFPVAAVCHLMEDV